MVWRSSLPFDWQLISPYHPKDVTGQNWNPSESFIYVFTPKIKKSSKWNSKMEERKWRSRDVEEEILLKNIVEPPKIYEYNLISI